MTPLEALLERLAMNAETMTYGAMSRELGVRMADLTNQLERLMETDAREGRPFRAALLSQRLSPDNLPAAGFFLKAQGLGQDCSDPAGFVADHRARLSIG